MRVAKPAAWFCTCAHFLEVAVGRSLWLAVFIACVVVAAAVSQSEVTADSTPSEVSLPVPEPTNAKPPAGTAKPFDPLALHDPGPPQAQWGYDDMSPEEQAVIDRGFETATWADAQKVHAAAAQQRYPAMAAKRAQLLLGVTDLSGAGVVP